MLARSRKPRLTSWDIADFIGIHRTCCKEIPRVDYNSLSINLLLGNSKLKLI